MTSIEAWLTERLEKGPQSGDVYAEGAKKFGMTRNEFKQRAYFIMYTPRGPRTFKALNYMVQSANHPNPQQAPKAQ